MNKVITVCNQKGGTGKTTTAINLAAYLAEQGKSILLVDIDPQSNATSGLGIDRTSVKTSIYESLLSSHSSIKEIIVSTQVKNLDLIPSKFDLSGAEIELVGIERREFVLQIAIDQVRSLYEYIFIDSPPSLGLLTVNAITAADSIIMPIQCEYYALEGLSQLLSTIELIKNNLNSRLEVEGAVLTMADFRTNLCQQVINEVRAFFKEKAYQTVVPRNVRLSEAPGFGKPVLLYDRTSKGALAYQELAREFLQRQEIKQERSIDLTV
jgi:chromosome partitioning protein